MKHVDLCSLINDLVLLLHRHIWRQAGRSLQPGVSLQHCGPSVLGGVRLPSGRPEGRRRRHRHFLAQQLPLAAVHAGQPHLQARLPRPVRGTTGKKQKKQKQTSYFVR